MNYPALCLLNCKLFDILAEFIGRNSKLLGGEGFWEVLLFQGYGLCLGFRKFGLIFYIYSVSTSCATFYMI